MRFEIDSGRDVIILHEARPRSGIGHWLTSVEGWDGTPAPREDSTARIGVDGSHTPLTLTQGPRTITLGGAALCHSSVEAMQLVDRVNGLWGRMLTVTRVDALGERWMRGLLRDDPKPVFHASGRLVTFSLVVQCDDPLKHGQPALYWPESGRVTVENAGTAPAWPVIRASNPDGVSFVSASCDESEVSWTGDGTAAMVELDFASMYPGIGVVDKDDAWPIPPGGMEFDVSASKGTAVEVECAPCWR